MLYKTYYNSLIGKMLLVSDEKNLIGLWIENQKYYLANLNDELIENGNLEILKTTKKWLDAYFKGKKPNISDLSLSPIGNEFRQNVWKILCTIPYGKTITYSEIAKKLAKKMCKKNMSAQAIGNAVGHNPISIIIPCHRVVGKSGNLTSYASGIDKKIKLLNIEKVDMTKYFIPTKCKLL